MSGSMRFDRAVEYYDRTRGLSEEASREMTVLLSSELRGRGRALEIGVGTGLVALPLAAAGVPLVGLDLSAPMLAKLVEKSGGRPPFPLVVGDATTLPFGEHRFGAAVVRHVLHLVPAWRKVVAELVRVVAPGGLVLVSSGQVPEPWHELTDRFMDRVGRPSFADALDSWETGAIVQAFRAHGAETRQLPRITERVAQTMAQFLDQMAAGMHSWTWEVDEEERREAVAELRAWAEDRWGSLDPPGGRDVEIEWHAFELHCTAPGILKGRRTSSRRTRVPITQVEKIWMDGELVPWQEAQVHVLSHAVHYGSGVFEGIRAYETTRGAAVWHLDEHLKRLFRSAKLYHIEIPYSREAITQATKDVIRANELNACYIRPLVLRGYGEMGVNPLQAPVNVVIAVWPWGAYLGEDALEEGVRIKISSWRRNAQNSLPAAAKATGQYINSVLAKVESLKAGYDEAIMLNEAGFVTDGSGENVFVVRDGVLTTPPISAGCLDGITRSSTITLARDLGYEVREENLVRTDLYNADECFFTGTAAELTPIREVDDRVVGEGHRGPVTKELQGAFFAATKGENEKYVHWLTYVND